jgi:hypothetical protein
MTLFADLIEETRHHLLTGQSDRLNQLLSGVSAGATTLQMKHPADGIREGTTLGIELEEYYVLAASGTTITVIPGYNGSTSAAHDADDVVRVKPHFSDYRISKYVNRALEDLSADGLFRIKQVEFTYNPAQAAYNINAADLIDVWRVKYDIPGPTQIWPDLSRQEWMLDQDANTTDFPNGKSLLLQRGGFPGHTVRVSYKAGFASLSSTTDDVLAVSGLHIEAHKLPPLGAAIYLLGGRDIKRTFLNRQPEPRRQEEVPVGGATQALRPILLEYSDNLRRERRRLRRRYPDSI